MCNLSHNLTTSPDLSCMVACPLWNSFSSSKAELTPLNRIKQVVFFMNDSNDIDGIIDHLFSLQYGCICYRYNKQNSVIWMSHLLVKKSKMA